MKRHASAVLAEQIDKTEKKKHDQDLTEIYRLVGHAGEVMETKRGPELVKELARMLHETWQIKKRLSSTISNTAIDELYEACLKEGALGGKLCGAGAGGFLLMVVPEERRKGFIEKLGRDRCVEFELDLEGVKIL
jgi:D-glycero-alpha-D-manno-heptose-7-phosphate kinase